MADTKRQPRHGTWNEYNRYGCRCDACREAAAAYMLPRNRAWRTRRIPELNDGQEAPDGD